MLRFLCEFVALDLLSWKFCLLPRLSRYSGWQQHRAEELEVYCSADPDTSGFFWFLILFG